MPQADLLIPERTRPRTPVVVVTLAAGATLLALTLGGSPGSDRFYALSLGLSAVWIVGAFAAGPIPVGRARSKIRVAGAVVLGAIAFGVFVVGDLLFHLVPPLHREVDRIIDRADTGSLAIVLLIAVVNGIGEELFFRGTLYDALRGRHALPGSTLVYVVVTGFAWNAALVVAAAVMGVVWVLERKVSRGVLAPVITHVTWSVLMILALPR